MRIAAGDEGISRTPGHDLVVVEPLQGDGDGPRGGLGMAMRRKIPRRALAALRLQPSEPSENIRLINLNDEVVFLALFSPALVFATAVRRFVMVHGFQKNTQKTPKPELDKALKRMSDVHSSVPTP